MKGGIRLLGLLAALVGLLAGRPPAARAQMLGLPVFAVPVPRGLSLAADVGFVSPEYCSAPTVCLGLTGMGGFGRLGVSGTVATSGLGAMGTLSLLSQAKSPFGLVVQGGIAGTTFEGGGVVVPFGTGFSFWIPTPVVSLEPWLGARGQYMDSRDGFGGPSSVHFAWSAGINLSLLNGLGLRVAYDRVQVPDNPLKTFSLGVIYSFHPGH